MKHISFLISFLFPLLTIAQNLDTSNGVSNMTLVGHWDGSTSSCLQGGILCYNEVWGYYDKVTGDEYAIIGSPTQVHIVDITTPSSPSLVVSFSGTYSSIWRDMKTYGDYLYYVHDNGGGSQEGMTIIDLSPLPTGTPTLIGSVPTSDFGRAHNIFIDEPNARLYVAGSNNSTGANGLVIYDLSNPTNPTKIKEIGLTGGYVHDLFVRDNIAYCNHGNNGMYAYDFTNISASFFPPLGNINEGGYNHSSWMTDDDNYVVFATEDVGVPLYIVDVSDLSNNGIVAISSSGFSQDLDPGIPSTNTAHNPLIRGNYCFVSYYEDGVQVWDITTPNSPVLVAYYDMVPNSSYNGTARGAWGVYPFLPSGNILVSDDLSGLYILRTTFPLPVELSYFEAKANASTVDLYWQTLSEENNEKFVIERSQDGQSFESIGEVRGAGNASQKLNYSFEDKEPLSGTSYYRLKQLDFDGQFDYSEVKSVKFKRGKEVVIYPNPTKIGNDVRITIPNMNDEEFISATLFDITGKQIRSLNPDGSTIDLNTSELIKGTYLFEIQLSDEVIRKKLIIDSRF